MRALAIAAILVCAAGACEAAEWTYDDGFENQAQKAEYDRGVNAGILRRCGSTIALESGVVYLQGVAAGAALVEATSLARGRAAICA